MNARRPEGRYSTLAGFVEVGEPLEMAVAREVEVSTAVIFVKLKDPKGHSPLTASNRQMRAVLNLNLLLPFFAIHK